MNYHEIYLYINEEETPMEIQDYIKKTITLIPNVSIKQSWENGYHICLFGEIGDIKEEITKDLQQLLARYPSKQYDEQQFRQKYSTISQYFQKEKSLNEIYQNKVMVPEKPNIQLFQNEGQVHLYLKIHLAFDRIFLPKYWRKNDIEEISREIYPFFSKLPDKTLSEEYKLYSNGFVSHLSHYVGFLHSIKEEMRGPIKQSFKQRKAQLGELQVEENALFHELQEIYKQVSAAIEREEMNFISPQNVTDVKDITKDASDYHQAFFQNEALLALVLHDVVLTTNKWVLNVLYEKLILLQLKPIDKFFMNYVFSSTRFQDEFQEVFE
ncbi:hypothetical protein [Bacillus sp. FJAT-45066]|uniref:hypothetical protein n=1 Tax=Bacillus sp. FJAT-45066 TaxID=2011010 RepID=UPI000BB7C4D6|nr:hypothetical protein [Bacillus sp. FJAT-45066]